MKPHLSIIVPVFNEEERIKNLKRIDDYLSKQNYEAEIVVVDDGSKDGTLQELNKLTLNSPLKIISYKKNKGKGYAIRQGVVKSKGRYRLFTDIDLSTPIKNVKTFLDAAEKGYEVVIGSRKRQGAKLVRRQPFLREILGKAYTFLSQFILGLNFSDFTCGFKLFSENSAKKIFHAQKINRWGFDSEILFLADKFDFDTKEIAVSWADDKATKVKLPRDIFTSLRDLFHIRINSLLGKYNQTRTFKNLAAHWPLLLVIVTALIVLWPIFSLALYGDDWLAFYRYRFHLGDWSNGQFNHLTYFLTPYGAQDILMGLLQKIFSYWALPYYILSFIFRVGVATALYLIVHKLSKSRLAGFISSLTFAITPIGADATNWVFNMPSYISLVFFGTFLFFFLRSQLQESTSSALVSAIFYYLAFVVAPIRMHGLPLMVIALDAFYLLKNRSKKKLKLVLSRQILMIFVFLFIRFSGQSMGASSEALRRVSGGISFISTSLIQGDFTPLLTPFIIVGRFFIPESVWPALDKLVASGAFSNIAFVSLLTFLPFFIVLKEIVKEKQQNGKLNTIIFSSVIVWTILTKLILSNSVSGENPMLVGSALIGGYFLILMLALIYVFFESRISYILFGGVAWTFLSFAFPYIWRPDSLLTSTHRYMIIPIFGFSICLGVLTSLTKNRVNKLFLILTLSLLVITHSLATNGFFSELVPVRGVKVSNRVWSTMPTIDAIGKEKGPLIFYFEGNSSIVYYLITFGLPPHQGLIYDIPEGNRIPVPMSSWQDVQTAVESGSNLPAYGYEDEPVGVNKIYAFRVKNDGTVIDITKQKREELNNYLITE